MKKTIMKKTIVKKIIAFLAAPLAALSAEETRTEQSFLLEPVQVIGSSEKVFELSGSGIYLGPLELKTFDFKNVNQTLRMMPGVYVRDEDGYGLFPNISIRGVDTSRSGKVTLMEDGILTAPAPYSAPSAYYSPTVGRMHAVEVLKGSSQIAYGPHTTGGVVNYVSTPIPYQWEGFAKAYVGSDGAQGGVLRYGGRSETDAGVFGSLFEIYREEADGFREILPSENGDFRGSGDTGYEKTDWMLKLGYETNSDRRNVFEFKVGGTDFAARETYLGLNPDLLAERPYARYAASAADEILTDHLRSYLRHMIEFEGDARLSSTLYYNAFERDWYKLDSVNGQNPAQAMMSNPGALSGAELADFKIKSNDREYYLYGIQSKYERSFTAGDTVHQLEVGVRLHKDKIDRFQDAAYFDGVYAGDFGTPSRLTGPDSEGDREQTSESIAVYARDRIQAGDWAFTPGLRWEAVDWQYLRRDKRDPAQTGSGSYSVFAPGIGVEYLLGERSKLFGGYHRGFSVPSPGSVRSGNKEEISDAFELGYRASGKNSSYLEAVAFYTLLDDLIVEDSIAGGPGDGNVGDVDTLGLELALGGDLSDVFDVDYSLPVRLSYTYTQAEIASLAASENPESIFSAGRLGSQVPYVPESQLGLRVGLELERFRIYTVGTHVGERYADSRNSALQENASGVPDARFGQLDSFFTVDLSAAYEISDSWEAFVSATNVFDESYVTSRLPHGPRAGAPRQWKTGVSAKF